MTTTVESSDQLFREVKSVAAERDQTLKEFVSEALQEQLASRPVRSPWEVRPWMNVSVNSALYVLKPGVCKK